MVCLRYAASESARRCGRSAFIVTPCGWSAQFSRAGFVLVYLAAGFQKIHGIDQHFSVITHIAVNMSRYGEAFQD